MKIQINFPSKITAEESNHLLALATIIERDYDISVQRNKQESGPSVKDGGLTIALTIANLAITAVGTLISVLSYWRSRNPKYSITLKRDRYTCTIDNLEPQKIEEVIAHLERQDDSTDIEVQIAGD